MKYTDILLRKIEESKPAFYAILRTIASALFFTLLLLAPKEVRAQVETPSAVYQPTLQRTTVFVTSAGHLFADYWNGTKWVWEDQGTPPGAIATGSVSAVYQPTSQPINVFVVGDNSHLFANYWNGTKWVWQDEGTPGVSVFGSSAVYQTAYERIIDFVGGIDSMGGHLYDLYWNGSKWVWEDQGTPPGTKVLYCCTSVYQPTPNRITAFVIGANGHLFADYWNGTKWVWEDQGTPPGTTAILAPSAVYQPTPERITVFVTGANGHLFADYWNGTKWIWEDQGTPSGVTVIGGPSAVYQPISHPITAFVVGNNAHLFANFWNGTKWAWQDQGIPPGNSGVNALLGLSAIYEPGRIVVFVVGTSTGTLYEEYWNGNKWVWEDLGQP